MAVVATGFFDGVHLGHRLVIETLVREARARGESAVVATFRPHPRIVLKNGARELRLLSSFNEKQELLLSLGVDEVKLFHFTAEFAAMTAGQYIALLKRELGATALISGYDNLIGSDRVSAGRLEEVAASQGVGIVRTPEYDAPETISSTRIRAALAAGEVRAAASMLGYDYGLSGVVVAGRHNGRKMGFPTANLELYEPLKLIPGAGVYLVGVTVHGRDLYGMCNIGTRPTLSNGDDLTVETHIFDFDEDIYGQDLSLHFLERIRDERRFASVEELRGRLTEDRTICQELLALRRGSI